MRASNTKPSTSNSPLRRPTGSSRAFVVITGNLIDKGGDAAQAAEFQRIRRLLWETNSFEQLFDVHDECQRNIWNAKQPTGRSTYFATDGIAIMVMLSGFESRYGFRYRGCLGAWGESPITEMATTAPSPGSGDV
jgi:hypothetical protein